MAEQIVQSDQLISIVVVGAMNPRIHHPIWYRQIEAISDAELTESLAQPAAATLLIAPMMSRFETGGIKVQCFEDRWEIQVLASSGMQRIFDMTGKVFTKLFETPVNRFGFNFHFHRETAVASVKERLADLATGLRLGFSEGGARASSIQFGNFYDLYSVNVAVAASPLGQNRVFVAHNMEYTILPEGYFDLVQKMTPHYDEDYQRAVRGTDAVVNGLNAV
jgi:hypothetical protein